MFPEEKIVWSKDFLLDPYRDFVFKHLFGLEGQEERLLSLINAVLGGKPQLESLRVLNREAIKKKKEDVTIGFDILGVTPDGAEVEIDIQCEAIPGFLNIGFEYQAGLFIFGPPEKMNPPPRKTFISIWFLKRIVSEKDNHTYDVILMFRGNGGEPNRPITDKHKTVVVELPKVKCGRNLGKEENMFILWMAFLKNPRAIPKSVLERVKLIGEAMADLKKMSADKRLVNLLGPRCKVEIDFSSLSSRKR
ncbi:MAG: Rpn family recombination-promoting nuclease/putative transposase [Rickettsiales bacterium]|jgi:hypothetical protein|nr:Rpn family recombination-promoting nuclease/putative transposase [Rickettsiales bacterium]